MKTFFYVLQKCIKSKQIIYPDEPFEPFLTKNYDSDLLRASSYIHLIMYHMHYDYSKCNVKNTYIKLSHTKLMALNTILNNICISNELKEQILEIFCKAQRIYFTLAKFANVCRYKRWPLVVTDDLTLNPLEINHPATFVMVQNKSRYLFSMNDLINIIESAICNAPEFFSTPLSPKNPYNNQKLSTSILCNIYFKMKEGTCKFSLIMHLFFLECFVKHKFYINNEAFLREYSIKRYIFTSPYETLHKAVILMLKHNVHTNKLQIHYEFPKDVLVDIFRPYLFYYYLIHFGIKGVEKIYKYNNQLQIKFRKFYEYNNLFGRKIVSARRRKKINKKPFTILFNSDHINFFNITVNSKCTYDKKNNASRLDRILPEYSNSQYDPDELFYANEFNSANDSDYED